MKKIIMLMTICFIFVLVFLVFIPAKVKNKSTIYDCKYYSLSLLDKWSTKVINQGRVTLYKDDKPVGYILCETHSNFDLNPSSIVSNFIGMHAYINGDYVEYNHSYYKYYKMYVAFEQSAAEQVEKYPPEPEQLHYFYIKDDMLLDLYIDLNLINEKEADMIAKGLVIKRKIKTDELQ